MNDDSRMSRGGSVRPHGRSARMRTSVVAVLCVVSVTLTSSATWAAGPAGVTEEPLTAIPGPIEQALGVATSPTSPNNLTDAAGLMAPGVVAESLLEGPDAAAPVEPTVSVEGNPVSEAPPVGNDAPVGAYGPDEVVVPLAVTEYVQVGTAAELDALAVARAEQLDPLHIFVGAAEVPQGVLTGEGFASAEVSGLGGWLDRVGGDLAAGDSPDPVTVAVGEEIAVEVIPTLEDGSLPGSVFAADITLSSLTADPAWVEVAFDMSGLEHAFGGDFMDRLQFVVLPECALTTPEVSACLSGVPLEARVGADGVVRVFAPADAAGLGDLDGGFAVPQGVRFGTSSGGTIIAAVSGASGQAGTFTATGLAPQGSWGVSETSGAFTYQIPIAAPPVTFGPVPNLGLNYSSAAVDARTMAGSAQTSLLGEGWASPTDYIERLYRSCKDDSYSGHDGDLCWYSPVASQAGGAAYVLSLHGQTYELVFKSTSGSGVDEVTEFWASSDPTVQVTLKRRSGTTNADNDGEFFTVKTSDGTVYYFGYGHVSDASGATATNSVATVPVYGNNTGEPGYSGGAGLIDAQAYRFMLDVVIDANSNGMTLFYAPETNKYAVGAVAGNSKPYTAALNPTFIEYGQHWADGLAQNPSAAQARVQYTVVDRCVERGQFIDGMGSGLPTCPTLNSTNAASFPDVPVDLICTATNCLTTQSTPAFFTTKRLDQITTQVAHPTTAGVWVDVDTTQLITAFPSTDDGSARALWLDSVYTHSWGDAASSTDDRKSYLIKFGGIRLNNRVDWSTALQVRSLDRMRIAYVINEFGGRVEVEYLTRATDTANPLITCPQTGKEDSVSWAAFGQGSPSFDWSANAKLCHSVKMGTSTGIFHNYVVTQVELVDMVAGTPTQTYGYTYLGQPAFAYDTSVLFARGTGDQSWGSFRGFEKVKVTRGTGATQVVTTNQYYRGLSGNYLLNGTSPAATITPMNGGSAIDDAPALQGRLLDSSTTANTVVVSESHMTYDIDLIQDADTGPGGDFDGIHDAVWVTTPTTESTSFDGSWNATTTSSTTYDTARRVPATATTTVDDNGSATSFTSCTQYTYADATSRYLTVVTKVESFDGTCAAGTLTGRSEILYDGATAPGAGNIPTVGLPTTEISSVTSTTTATSKATYDTYGRIIAAWTPKDVAAEGDPSVEWDYTIEDGLWKTTVTRPLGQESVTWAERTRGNVIKTDGPNLKDTTYYQYDATGLLIAGWAPTEVPETGEPDLAEDPATAFFLYDVYAPGPAIRSTPVTVVQASLITDDGTDFAGVTGAETVRRSYTFLDGWGRTLEQHSPAADGSGGRTVTATKYNSLGQVEWVSAPFWNTQSAQIAHGLVNPNPADLLSYTAYTYDAGGRTITQSLSTEGDPVATTTTTYGGLATTVESPNGAQTVATTDLRGRLLSQVQHPDTAHSSDPSITTEYLYETLTGGGSRVTVEDAEGNETVFESNMAGQRTTMIDPNSGTSTYTYDLNGQTTKVVSNAGVIRMDYDVLGRMFERRAFAPGIDDTVASNAQSTTTWTFNDSLTSPVPATAPLGALTSTESTSTYGTGPSAYDLTTIQETTEWDEFGRPLTQQVTLPTHSMLGDLSGYVYETAVTYDALGQVASTEYPAAGGLPNELTITGYRLSGQAETLTLTDAATTPTWSTDVVTATSVDGTGLFQSRTYGNGVIRQIGWDAVWRAPSVVSAFADLDASDGFTTGDLYLQNDSFTRDNGRVTAITDAATASPVTECFTYDGHNRLASAWQQTGSTCGTSVSSWGPTTGAGSATAFGTEWEYSDSGRILTIVNAATGTTDTFDYPTQGASSVRPHAATEVETTVGETVTATDTFEYDTAGRQTSRIIDYVDTGNPGTTTTLTWDVLSNLTHTSGAGGDRIYIYDASGQRLAQIRLYDSATPTILGTATAYLGATELTDPDTATTTTGDVTGTRFYTFGGATVAVRTITPTTSTFSLLLGDVQGSAQVMMPTTLNSAGVMAAATTTDVTTALAQRSFYLPYGATRGTDNLPINHGWLNQTEDGTITGGGTGLTYLNARYYDPVLSRFLSPDPLMNPSDPRTLDPYMYATNNPVTFQDASGLCYGVAADRMAACANGWKTATKSMPATAPVQQTQGWTLGGENVENQFNYNVNQCWDGGANYSTCAERVKEAMIAGTFDTTDYTQPAAPPPAPGNGLDFTALIVGLLAGAAATAACGGNVWCGVVAFGLIGEVTYEIVTPPEEKNWGDRLETVGLSALLGGLGSKLTALSNAKTAAAAANTSADHIVLGLRGGLDETAASVGGRTLLSDPNWRGTLLNAVANPNARFTVALDGFSGTGTWSQVMGAAQRGLTPAARATEWEMAMLVQGERLADVTFLRGGKVVPNPWAG